MEITYPYINGRLIQLEDRDHDNATGKIITLDFSDIRQEAFFESTKNYIIEKYQTHGATVTFLRVLLPAVKHFDNFAATNSITCFSQYNDTVKAAYSDYLDTVTTIKGGCEIPLSDKYKRYLLSVPRMLQSF